MDGVSYVIEFDYENRLAAVRQSETVAGSFLYDGDGNRVKTVMNDEAITFVGNMYEKKVMGSTTTATGANGELVASAFYEAWGEMTPVFGDLPTARRYTGQLQDPPIAGIYYYGARYYDPALGRFLQADTIVPQPGNPQSLNRYSYVLNNPLRYVDPSGHRVCEDVDCTYRSPTFLVSQISRKYSLKAWIVTKHFIRTVRRESARFKLPPELLAASMYAEMNSRWLKDDLEDFAVAAVGRCAQNCGGLDGLLAAAGQGMIDKDQSFGPAKIKPSAVLNGSITVPALRAAGVRPPSDPADAAVQSLGFDRSVQFAAAYLKGLADLRMREIPGNAGSRELDMLKVDMQVVRVAYNEGLASFLKLGNNAMGYYETTTLIVQNGAGDEVSPWLDAFAEIFGP